MKTINWKKRFPAVILAGAAALVIAAAGLKLPSIYAADAIETDRACSLSLSVADTGSFAAELAETKLDVKLYRVASVALTGKYSSTEAFASLKIESLPSGAEDWENVAMAAAELVQGGPKDNADEKEEVGSEKKVAADYEFSITNGIGKADNLATGMYLVMVDQANTDLHEYSFKPYLIALPDNLYYQSGDARDDYWQYDAEGGLKPEQNPRYGGLRIRKTLTDYNESLRETTFVFQIEGVDEEGKTVYSNAVSTTHNAAGTKEAVIDKIPAGARVTVTEVYSGASYEPVTSPEGTVTIVADEVMSLDFTNTYSGKIIPGHGVTNRFDYDGDEGWKWTQLEDSSVAGE